MGFSTSGAVQGATVGTAIAPGLGTFYGALAGGFLGGGGVSTPQTQIDLLSNQATQVANQRRFEASTQFDQAVLSKTQEETFDLFSKIEGFISNIPIGSNEHGTIQKSLADFSEKVKDFASTTLFSRGRKLSSFDRIAEDFTPQQKEELQLIEDDVLEKSQAFNKKFSDEAKRETQKENIVETLPPVSGKPSFFNTGSTSIGAVVLIAVIIYFIKRRK